jgi:hypothetical protein
MVLLNGWKSPAQHPPCEQRVFARLVAGKQRILVRVDGFHRAPEGWVFAFLDDPEVHFEPAQQGE